MNILVTSYNYERKKLNFPVLSFDVAVRFSPVWFGFLRFGSQLVNRRETMVRFVNLWYGSVIFGSVQRFGSVRLMVINEQS
jgi:hypothetical protein